MNLAEIRKKAVAAKRVDAVSADIPEVKDNMVCVEPTVSTPPDSEAVIAEEFYCEPEISFAENLVDNIISDPVVYDETISENEELHIEENPVEELPAFDFEHASTKLIPDAASMRSINSPLELIIAGREAAADSENQSTSQFFSASTEIEEYLCFRVANEEYAINIMAIKEIIKPREVTEVPRAPLFIQGVISLRGLIVPVMDMRCRLSLAVNSATGRERIVVIRKDTGFCGILVDEVIQVARIAKKDIEDPPTVLDGIDRAFVKGLGHYEGRMIILLDLEVILDVAVH